jgi:GR25 family glycosyltransferase involved in LPS biosynthesis
MDDIYRREDNVMKLDNGKPKISKYWITSIVLWVVLVVVLIILIILWQTGVIFQSGSSGTTALKEIPIPIPTCYAEHTLESAVLKVATYDPINVTREEEFTVSREKPVIEKFNREVPSEIINLPTKVNTPKIATRRSVITPRSVATPTVDTPTVDTPIVDTPIVDTPIVDTPIVVVTETIDSAESLSTKESKSIISGNDESTLEMSVSTQTEQDSEPVEVSLPMKLEEGTPGLGRFIEHIMYINLDEHHGKREKLEEQIELLHLPDFVLRERLSAVKRSNNNLGKFLSHIACLSKALPLKKNVLILEDDFVLNMSSKEILTAFEGTQNYVENRWDVICLTQNVSNWKNLTTLNNSLQICKLLNSTSTVAYLVNKLYLPKLLAFYIQQLRVMLQQGSYTPMENLQTELQSSDLWIGYHVPVGFVAGQHQIYLADLTSYIDEKQVVHNIEVQPHTDQKKVAICHIATGKYNQYVNAIQKDCYLKFLKLHHVEFFLFTDDSDLFDNDRTEEGAKLKVRPVINLEKDLFRFSSIMSEEAALTQFDYIYYMDVNYRLYQHPFENDIMIDGVVATSLLHNIPNSDFSVGFFGGAAIPTLTMLHTISIRSEKGKTDEFYFNQYLQMFPPTSVLSQSYMFSERCLDISCKEPLCRLLRESNLTPILGPVA